MSEESLEKTSQDIDGMPAKEGENMSAQTASVTLNNIRDTLEQVDAQLRQLEAQLKQNTQSDRSAPQSYSPKPTTFIVLAIVTAALVIAVRLYKLNTIQTDFYGDIEIVYRYVEGVRIGNWPFQYVLGVGPIYHYLIQPIILFTGLNYLGLKISAIITSLGILAALFAFARRLVDDTFALLAVAVAGVSSWLLIFSRLGISLILVPLLLTVALWLMIRFIHDQRPINIILCALVSAAGLYSYPAGFILPFVSFITLLCLRFVGHPISWKDLRLFVIATIVGALPFAWMVLKSPDDFIHGYIGSKFFAEEDTLKALMRNIVSAALAYHVKGDVIFRSNPVFQPHLDRLSGLLFLAGILFWLQPARRRWSPLVFVPFILLHIPSVMVLGRPGEVPSAGRTLSVAPIAYLLVASGVWLIIQFFAQLGRQRLGVVIASLLFGLIFMFNMQNYFGNYISGLPYHDTSIGGRIAAYADSLPADTQIYVVGCCWEAGLPELPFIQVISKNPANMHQLDANDLTCDRVASLPQPAILIWSFHDLIPSPQLDACKQWLPPQLYISPTGLPVFYAAPLLKDFK